MRIKSAKVQRKCALKVKWLKIDGCMHPLLKIEGCSCTLCTRYYELLTEFYFYRPIENYVNKLSARVPRSNPGTHIFLPSLT